MNLKHRYLILIGLIFLIICPIFYFFSIYVITYPVHFKTEVEKYSKEYGINQSLIYSVIKRESSFNKNAKSNAGACGLMQILPSTAEYLADLLDEEFEEKNLFEVDKNIKYGTFYLKYLFKKFKTEREVLSAYNAGEGTVYDWLKNEKYSLNGKLIKIPFKETRDYTNAVQKYAKAYKRFYRIS